MLKADDDDADPHDDPIEGVQLHLQPRQGQDLGRVAAVDSQLAQVGLSLHPGHDLSYIDTLVIVTILLTISISLLVLTLHSASSWQSSSSSGLFPSSRRLDILSPVNNLIFCHIVCAR